MNQSHFEHWENFEVLALAAEKQTEVPTIAETASCITSDIT